MAYYSENSTKLNIRQVEIETYQQLSELTFKFPDVCVLRLPACQAGEHNCRLKDIEAFVRTVAENLDEGATLVTLGEVIDLVKVHVAASEFMRYQLWAAIKTTWQGGEDNAKSLPNHHFGALVHTKYAASLRHTKTRIAYSYCPVCDKTTKDYGGKKHTYHEYGTLISDVWRDISCELNGDIQPVLNLCADLFGVEPHKELLVLDLRPLHLERMPVLPIQSREAQVDSQKELPDGCVNRILNGDCLEQLVEIPNNSIDFVFVDPPYNLGKNYRGYGDDLTIKEYFKWCDTWLAELARVLKPGRTLALLNIPLWAIRHFIFLETILDFQSWIAWDALSFPVRMIMPSHYAILCFSKGLPREMPGLVADTLQNISIHLRSLRILEPLAEGYCLRNQCEKKRRLLQVDDRGLLSDLWWDVHRLKHNSRRVDHPTQLPPMLLYRLIALFTYPGEIVLDCFNGSGTTTLAAHQLGRQYVGIEKSYEYYSLAKSRHDEVLMGVDPFRKAERILTSKNSRVPRMPKQKYKVSKKVLQLEVRRVARELGRLPTREEMALLGKYPIEYYNEYFASWGEVCAAARTTGMTETRDMISPQSKVDAKQLSLFEK